MSTAFKDVRFSIRMLLKHKAFTLVSVTVLALGIGANTAIFSVVYAVLLKPLPYEKPDELHLLWESTTEIQRRPFSKGSFLDWKEHSRDYLDIAGFSRESAVLTGDGEPLSLGALGVSANIFTLLGHSVWMGRGFAEGEDQPGAAPVVILSQALWQRRYGASREIIGRSINLNGVPHAVIGVLSSDFLFPPPVYSRGALRQFDPEIFIPLICNPEERVPWGVHVVARLKPGISMEQAQARLQSSAAALIQERPEYFSEGLKADLDPVREQGVGQSRLPLLVLLASVVLVLLIACFNVATLLLARASGRFKEVAVRMALGAGRGRIIRQLLTESLALALLAGLAGVVLAYLSLQTLLQLAGGYLPLLDTVSINLTVLAFTLLAALTTGVLFGLAPALQSSKLDLTEALKEGARGGSSSLGRQKLRTVMVAAEVSIAVVMLVGAGLLLKSLFQLQKIDLGFDPENVLIFRMELPETKYSEADQIQFVSRLEQEAKAVPGVEQAALVTLPPLSPGRGAGPFDIEGRPASGEEQRSRFVYYRQISPAYFETLRIPVIEGRAFEETDRQEGLQVCLIDEHVAERYWPQGDAVGSTIIIPSADTPGAVSAQVAGVVGHVKYSQLKSSWGTIYYPLSQQSAAGLHLLVRAPLGTRSVSEPLRRQIAKIDPGLPVSLRSYDSYIYAAQAGGRSPAILLGIFAGLALVLALGGLYGVLSYLVGQRRQEIGLRMAMGAGAAQIVRLVGGQTAFMVAAGLLLGLAAALGLSQLISTMLYEVSPADPWTFAAVALLFAAVSLLAAYLPTRRACKVDPMTALRTE